LGVSGAERGGSGSFAWAQNKDRADVQIRGPVGIGGVHLQMSGSASQPELRLETSDGQVFHSGTAWAELEARLGASLPAGRLRYWMLGVPAPGAHEWITPPDGETATLEQDGWRIEYRYSDASGTRLPIRIRAASGAARVRIVVDRWQLGR
jgi:outer membrane lipoprotein LolB